MNQTQKQSKLKENEKRENMAGEIDLGRFFEVASSDKIYVNNLNLPETKNEYLQDHTGDFELIGSMFFGEIEQKTNTRFEKNR